MKQVYRIDEVGFYIEPVMIEAEEETPQDCVEVMPPSMYKAHWTGSEWVEAGEPPTPSAYRSVEDELQEVKQTLDFLLMGGM